MSSENGQLSYLKELADKLGVVLNESILDAHSSMALSIYSPSNLADLLTDEVKEMLGAIKSENGKQQFDHMNFSF